MLRQYAPGVIMLEHSDEPSNEDYQFALKCTYSFHEFAYSTSLK